MERYPLYRQVSLWYVWVLTTVEWWDPDNVMLGASVAPSTLQWNVKFQTCASTAVWLGVFITGAVNTTKETRCLRVHSHWAIAIAASQSSIHQMLFKSFYWSTQLFSASHVSSPITTNISVFAYLVWFQTSSWSFPPCCLSSSVHTWRSYRRHRRRRSDQ